MADHVQSRIVAASAATSSDSDHEEDEIIGRDHSADDDEPEQQEAEGQQAEQEEDGGVTIEIDEATAEAIAEVGGLLRWPVVNDTLHVDAPTLESMVAESGGPIKVVADPVKGRKVVATRDIAEGEVVLIEEAVAICMSRSPGTDAVFSMTEKKTGVLVCTLPSWFVLRITRDTLTLAPKFRGEAEKAFRIISQLTAFGSTDHSGWDSMPECPPGIDADDENNAVPVRAQLLQAIAQANAFVVPLPEDDSDWKGALLWPMLGRIRNPEDREKLFEDPHPLSHLSGFFPMAACINHSCNPNITYAGCGWDGSTDFPVFSFRSTRTIKEGEECCYAYLHPDDEAVIRSNAEAAAKLNAGSASSSSAAPASGAGTAPSGISGVEAATIPAAEHDPSSAPGSDSDAAGGAGDAGSGARNDGAEQSAGADRRNESDAERRTRIAEEAANRRYKLLLTYRFKCYCDRCLSDIPALTAAVEDPARDPLAKHFPYGLGIDGVQRFYEMGGKYPRSS